MKKKRIALIGSYPPPYGGISVYIKRLSSYLTEHDFEHTCYAYGAGKSTNGQGTGKDTLCFVKNTYLWLFKYFFSPQEQIIHLNKTTPIHFLIFGLLRKFRNIRFIINRHGEHLYGVGTASSNKSIADSLKTHCYDFGFRNADHIIMVNEKMRPALHKLGIPDARISCIPAFIPPPTGQADISLPEKMIAFISRFKYIMTAFGSITLFKHQDLYGIDMLVDLMQQLKTDDTGLIIYLRKDTLSPEEEQHYNQILQRINSNDLNKKIFLHEPFDEEFWPVLTQSHIFIRPTNTDGDAVSIREALFFNVKTICSDVTNRPQGVILFKNRDMNDLRNTVQRVIKDLQSKAESKPAEKQNYFSNAERITEIYKTLVKTPCSQTVPPS